MLINSIVMFMMCTSRELGKERICNQNLIYREHRVTPAALSYFIILVYFMSNDVDRDIDGLFSTDTSDPDNTQAVLLALLPHRQRGQQWVLSLTALNSLNSIGMLILMVVGVSVSGSRQWVQSMPMSRQQDTSFSSAWPLRERTAATSPSETTEVGNNRPGTEPETNSINDME